MLAWLAVHDLLAGTIAVMFFPLSTTRHSNLVPVQATSWLSALPAAGAAVWRLALAAVPSAV